MPSLADTLYGRTTSAPGMLLGVEVATPVSDAELIGMLSLSEVKNFLYADGDDYQDRNLLTFIGAARKRLEAEFGVAIGAQTQQATFAGPAATVRLPRAPLVSVTATQVAGADRAYTLTNGLYASLSGSGGDALLNTGETLEVTYAAGWAKRTLPENVKTAWMMLVGTYFETRQTVVVGRSVQRMPEVIDDLMQPYGRALC